MIVFYLENAKYEETRNIKSPQKLEFSFLDDEHKKNKELNISQKGKISKSFSIDGYQSRNKSMLRQVYEEANRSKLKLNFFKIRKFSRYPRILNTSKLTSPFSKYHKSERKQSSQFNLVSESFNIELLNKSNN